MSKSPTDFNTVVCPFDLLAGARVVVRTVVGVGKENVVARVNRPLVGTPLL